ncbi:hypothetical protein HIM_09790 [Hirsutella minnesotensis 3608]|uniref:Calpain catalytic domain-containing protein n=1 Tax=Hirsutella minnesotensis 3608 TaxID=1043627 RepID=A0A0F7ZGG1_9HYPO|nr:hypothetical protein HIM_09790 [Hirsutella minnesotensis 3608]
MSAITGPNIGRGRRFRLRSPSSSRSSSASSSSGSSTPSQPVSGPAFRRRGTMASSKRPKQQAPQAAVDEFWAKFNTTTPGKATTVLPQNQQLVDRVVRRNATPSSSSAADGTTETETVTRTTQASYDEAAAVCRAKVAKIIKECRRINKKYRDPHFDLESDLKLGRRDCLESLANRKAARGRPGSSFCPRSAKRVTEIFDRPQFYIDGPTANDVRQGRDGDCWLMSALCTLSNKPGLIERLCVAHDQDVGVYGFVFYRDGEWISEIVDDFLYLTKSDYDESLVDRVLFDELQRVDPEETYRRIYQSNSSALYFAQCENPQETWLPLLEKCYAKAHGDYAAIEGGFGGEGIEDLTGGVTSEIFTTDILDKEYFWKEELLKVNKDFLFGCDTGVWGRSSWGERKGIVELHSYSVQKAVEIDGKRLVRLKNPWGKGEWKGPWSDGSKEWTPEWLEKLDHRFGDDGDFWIAYEDLLRKYQAFERTRLFDHHWRVAQIWTTLTVPWMLDYHKIYFSLSVSKPGPVVIVLSQLDERYFRGLEGQYQFQLGLRLHKAGHEDYIVRSQSPYRMQRSVNVELELEAGEYDVRIKIDACRREHILPIEKVIRNSAKDRREKLTRIGLAYDLAHGKGKIIETAEEKAAIEAHDKRTKIKLKEDMLKKIQAEREEQHYLKKKDYERARERRRRAHVKRKAHVAAREAKQKEGVEADPGATATERKPDGTHDLEEKDATAKKGNGSKSSLKEADADAADIAQKPKQVEPETADPPQGKGTVVHGAESRPATGNSGIILIENTTRICESDSDLSSDDMDNLSELSERELDIKIQVELDHLERTSREQAKEPNDAGADADEFERDPWNAVAVVGLRVYHRAGDGDAVRLKVVRPMPYADEQAETGGGGSGGDSQSGSSRVLDVDDSAKDATLVGGVTERKKSIVGNDRRAS